MAKVRPVRAEPASVLEEIDRWCKQYPRIKELWTGFIWRLSREPEKGYDKFADGNSGLLFKIKGSNEFFPLIIVRYKYTDEEVIILGIKIIPQL